VGERASDTNGSGREILIVEDHAATAEMVMIVLEDAGYHTTWVSTARAVLSLFEDLPSTGSHALCPDLILLDLTLPDMDPVEMVRQIIDIHGSRPPVIVVSAKNIEAVQAAANAIGALAIVHKPFPLDTLLDNIDLAFHPTA
jgi:DNA-binding response OmpR family regulator